MFGFKKKDKSEKETMFMLKSTFIGMNETHIKVMDQIIELVTTKPEGWEAWVVKYACLTKDSCNRLMDVYKRHGEL